MAAEFDPHDCIFHLLAKAAKSGSRFWKETMADLGLTAVQGKVLNFIYISGEITASELSMQAGVDNATLTGVLDRLESINILERHAKTDDRRAILIRLTEHGQSVAAQVYQRIEPANEAFLKDLSGAETAMLRDLLKRF